MNVAAGGWVASGPSGRGTARFTFNATANTTVHTPNGPVILAPGDTLVMNYIGEGVYVPADITAGCPCAACTRNRNGRPGFRQRRWREEHDRADMTLWDLNRIGDYFSNHGPDCVACAEITERQRAMTDEERAAQARERDARIIERRQEQTRAAQEANRRVMEAQTRSMELLNEWLTPIQRKQIEVDGCFTVQSNRGNWFRIKVGSGISGNVYKLSGKNGHPVCSYCAHPRNMPVGDTYLAQALALQTDENAFLAVAVQSFMY